MVYNVRGVVGKKKSKFIKKEMKDKIDRLLKSTAGKQGRCSDSKIKVSDKTDSEESKDLLQGRAIIEKQTMAKNMWCNACDHPWSLRYLQYEKFQGIVSKWFIKCHICATIVAVETGQKSNKKFYDTNLKSAIGMLDAGIGESKLNTYLSSLNVHAFDDKLLKRNERYVGNKIEDLAKQSCVAALEKEKFLILQYQSKMYVCPC